jgi:hypothetical protein
MRKITYNYKEGDATVSSWYDVLTDPTKVNSRSP